MKSVKIFLKSAETAGKIKKLNGGNLAPPLYAEKAGCNIRRSFAELNMPLTRLHDAPLENPGMRLVDVPQIFANFHADENDPRNYYFDQTDDYIRNCIEGGTGICYRLGVSIEHGVRKYFTAPPSDVAKWINICERIIRHYTEGWANGFHFGIRYWEIWNEPECADADGVHLMWSGTHDEYIAFYIEAASELKKRFPHLMFGGPAHCSFGELSRAFIAGCAQKRAPLDFYSYHCYTADPYGPIQRDVREARKMLDGHGYTATELHLNEWHYFPGEWSRLRSDSEYKDRIYEQMRGLESAAFLSTVQALWQDVPLDMGCYYTATTTAWGLYKRAGDTPTKSYYGMKAFGEIVRYPERIAAESSSPDVTVLAGSASDGRMALLVSSFKAGPAVVAVTVDFAVEKAKTRLLVLDETRNLEPAGFECSGRILSFMLESESAVALLLFDQPGCCIKGR